MKNKRLTDAKVSQIRAQDYYVKPNPNSNDEDEIDNSYTEPNILKN